MKLSNALLVAAQAMISGMARWAAPLEMLMIRQASRSLVIEGRPQGCGVPVGTQGRMEGEGPAAVLSDALHGVVRRGLVTAVGQCDDSAVLGEPLCDGAPDAPAASGDERDLSFKSPHIHGGWPPLIC
ncbi:hypothetical protein SLA_6956 [Streptomyces laurentii]|uniref:Uncharacterized protein n=1 Tax=Streptomyces laurentii TaxID=39478 RepID=A0A169PHE8_STRLU|nr:hypothetical protein SLA_6956 [Streptomyces laurentii]